MKQFMMGIVIGSVLTGAGVFALTPLEQQSQMQQLLHQQQWMQMQQDTEIAQQRADRFQRQQKQSPCD